MSDEIKKTIGKLAEALAKAQAKITHAAKDRENPHFKSKYATLASVWDAVREPLTANGLSVVQTVESTQDGAFVEVRTHLLHSSGESMESSLKVPVAQRTAQGMGSAITYARRYALAAMVGVAPDDDDDGNAASQGQAPANGVRSAPRQQVSRSASAAKAELEKAVAAKVETLHKAGGMPIQDDAKPTVWERILRLGKDAGHDEKTIGSQVRTLTGKMKTSTLNEDDLKKFAAWLDDVPAETPAQAEEAAPF
jgi:hypothetical protein